jgi:hypothetical protein
MPSRRVRERYEDVVLRTKPVLYLPMQGSTTQELVRMATATVTNAVRGHTGPFPGAQSVRFAGANDLVSVATDASYHPGNTFSIGGWFNRTGAGDGSGAALYHAGSGEMTVWFPPATGVGRLTLRKAGTADIWRSDQLFGTPYNAGWYHYIFTKAGATTVLYLNGVTNGSAVGDQTITTTTDAPTFGLASAGGTNLDYVGQMAHHAIWNRALTAGEVMDLYRAGRDFT